MSAIVPYEQGSPEWHALRAKHIGASEVAALFDVQPNYALSRWSLWQVKSGRAEPPPVDNPRVHWGIKLEQVIAEAAAEQEGWALRKGGYAKDAACPGLGASLDYEIDPNAKDIQAGRSGPGALEIKNSDWLAHRRSWTDDEPPVYILLQLQAQLAASGYTWGAVACLIGGNDLRIYRYDARPKLISDIRRRVVLFWRSIADGKEPPVDGSDSASAILKAMYAPHIDEEADLSQDNELPEICAQMLDAAERRKAAEREEAEAKNRIFLKLGDHKRAVTQGFRVNMAVTPAKADRTAAPGEIIKGRSESRRLTIKESQA